MIVINGVVGSSSDLINGLYISTSEVSLHINLLKLLNQRVVSLPRKKHRCETGRKYSARTPIQKSSEINLFGSCGQNLANGLVLRADCLNILSK